MSLATERKLFRLATASFAVGLALCGLILSFAQSGPNWEVPQTVVNGLMLGLGTVFVLVLVGVGMAFTANFYTRLPTGARVAHFVVAIIVLLLPPLIWLSEPAQWVIRAPGLSRIATLLPIPSILVASLIFWFIAVRGLIRSTP